MKNIPNYSKLQYQKVLISKSESFIKRMRWKLFAIQNPEIVPRKQTYRFNTTKKKDLVHKKKIWYTKKLQR